MTLFENLQSGIKGIKERRLYKAVSVDPVRLKKRDGACGGPGTRSWIIIVVQSMQGRAAPGIHLLFNKYSQWLSCQALGWALSEVALEEQ